MQTFRVNLDLKTFDKYQQSLRYDNDYVYSYGTRVAAYGRGTLSELGYWSKTTQKHINYAAKELGLHLIGYNR
mgnify:FL=1